MSQELKRAKAINKMWLEWALGHLGKEYEDFENEERPLLTIQTELGNKLARLSRLKGKAMRIISSLIVLLALCSCGPKKVPCETPNSTRCKNNNVEICNPDGLWILISDCSIVEPGEWTCQALPEGDHSCLKKNPDVPDAPPSSESTSTEEPASGGSGAEPSAPKTDP